MKLAANLTWLFTERPLLDRPAAARQAGFDGVEVLFPYDTPPKALKDALDAAGLPLVLINTPKGETTGCAAIPDAVDRFRNEFAEAVDYARTAGAGTVHVMAGVTQARDARATFSRNLAWAAAEAPDLRLTIEPLNPKDVPGYFLNDFHLAARIVTEVGAVNLRLQFDAYHADMIHGDIDATWRAVRANAGHVQIAAAPARTAPDHRTLGFLCRLGESGYDGWIAAEYDPGGPT